MVWCSAGTHSPIPVCFACKLIGSYWKSIVYNLHLLIFDEHSETIHGQFKRYEKNGQEIESFLSLEMKQNFMMMKLAKKKKKKKNNDESKWKRIKENKREISRDEHTNRQLVTSYGIRCVLQNTHVSLGPSPYILLVRTMYISANSAHIDSALWFRYGKEK